ncbi:hypothetical protein ACD877_22375, partial [Escherichia coli]
MPEVCAIWLLPSVAPSLSVAGVIFDLSAQGDIHYQVHQQVSFGMATGGHYARNEIPSSRSGSSRRRPRQVSG